MVIIEDMQPSNTNSNHESSIKPATLIGELWTSSEIVFGSRLTWLLVFGPIAIAGDTIGFFGEFVCFIFSVLALIPCAERLSFVTEQVAVHTNSTIGALLNATFGNAPEFLISSAALRAGFYRVVQLTLLGSILCNLLLVFGVSCFIGGLRWQVQEVILTSGNVSIGMLLIATAGLLLPAALKLSNQEMFTENDEVDAGIQFSRFNAAIMLFMYLSYLLFQLATHKDEFDDDASLIGIGHSTNAAHPDLPAKRINRKTRRNTWCRGYCFADGDPDLEVEMTPHISNEPRPNDLAHLRITNMNGSHDDDQSSISMDGNDDDFGDDDDKPLPQSMPSKLEDNPAESPYETLHGNVVGQNRTILRSPIETSKIRNRPSRRITPQPEDETNTQNDSDEVDEEQAVLLPPVKAHSSDYQLNSESNSLADNSEEVLMSLRAGIVWLLAITLCISAISDVIVDTIDGFAEKCQLSEIFTSVIIIPFFSNIAEQVSAVLFAYRNKMDLCLGVTVGSAIQISTCVLPGCILIGWAMDRSISLFFEGYETCCLVLGVLSVSAILHGGTTNWLVGAFFIGMYFMLAAGFWFHVLEDLSIDEELFIHNVTNTGDDM